MLTFEVWKEQGDWYTLENGYRVFYTVQGSGLPVLFLHGFPTSSHDYARLPPLLAGQYQLIFLDFLGYGFSDKPRKHTYSLFEQADIVQALATHLGLKKLYLVSHDMGNSVALEVLRRGTPVVEKYVMLNGSVLLKYYQPVLSQRALLHKVSGHVVSLIGGLVPQALFARQFGAVFAIKPTAKEFKAFRAAIRYNNGHQIHHKLILYLQERKTHEHTWLDALHTHPAPLTVIWGLLDPVAVPRIAQAVLERRPDARYIPLEKIGHYPQWEDPATVAGAIRWAFQQ